jgi:amidohydrolase
MSGKGDLVGWKERVRVTIAAKRNMLEQLALEIGENPELGFEEIKAARSLMEILQDAGYEVTGGIAGLKTAFSAVLGQGGPNIALLCEYDALPGLGHACGHNLIAMASVGAALGLAPCLDELGGTITVLGTPAEETGSGKVILVKAGFFDQVDVAMMFHPSNQNLLMATSNALDAYEFEFIGKAAHAADSPDQGINALDGVIALFNGVNALREHLPEGVRVHGIIAEGGTAANIVPAKAVARFYLRAPSRELLNSITVKVLRMAEGAALMTGTRVEWHEFELGTDNMMPSHPLALAFGANLQRLGVTDIEELAVGRGSSDMGNVSRVVPSIHPYLSMGEGLIAHTPEFAAASLAPEGIQAAMTAAEALACTAVDLIMDPLLLEMAKDEHARRKESGQ